MACGEPGCYLAAYRIANDADPPDVVSSATLPPSAQDAFMSCEDTTCATCSVRRRFVEERDRLVAEIDKRSRLILEAAQHALTATDLHDIEIATKAMRDAAVDRLLHVKHLEALLARLPFPHVRIVTCPRCDDPKCRRGCLT